ncbi:MAG: DUF2934 domain-containing protein [Candidatus Omnitrophota bacterium]|jgi:hypothetical protein
MARTGFGKSATSKVSADSSQIAEMIRKKAYELYEKRGKKCGRSMDDWLEAERIIKQKSL